MLKAKFALDLHSPDKTCTGTGDSGRRAPDTDKYTRPIYELRGCEEEGREGRKTR